ncbi:adhesion G-protein coupled receptor G5 isoform X2 [Pseudorasbora parva]|uniref:adhesion G-protein coupled receptor G5 isoform X2 n=1 Tax=Pseudorasbora parva TaxID=51549 RepID=UPI00351E4E4A
MKQSLERLNISSPALQMFLRNLEILSGMKWGNCVLLLTLSAAFCISAEDGTGPCTPNCNKPNCTNSILKDLNNVIYILGADGFMGYMKTEKNPRNISVFSFSTNCTGKTISTTYSSGCGVNISRNSIYKLNISRAIIPKFFCLIEGTCRNDTWINWIAGCQNKDCFDGNVTCNMTCLSPNEKCGIAKYDSSCRDDNAGDESKVNTIGISNKTADCFKCGSPLQIPKEVKMPQDLSNKFNNTKNTETNAVAAAEVMKNLSSLLSLMENLTVASVSMGSVTGVLKKIQSQSDIKESAFILLETGIRVLEDFSELKNFPNAFTIPKEAIQQAFNNTKGTAFLGVFRFPNMSKDENNSTVLGDVYAIEMGTSISNLTNNISLAFSNKQRMVGTPVCSSWDGQGKKPNWTTEGCITDGKGDNITCNCSHLTFFAVLMAPPGVPISQNDLVTLTYISYIGCGLSMFFLGVALFIHFLLRKAKATNSAHVLMNLFIALFLLNLTFLTNEYIARMNSHIGCKVMAGVMHYSLLATFSWFAVEALHLCLQMTKHSVVIKHYILKISVAGWVPPAIVVSIIFVLGKYGEQNIQTESSNVTMCWILDSTVHYAVNIGYYCFVFIFTFSTFIVVLRWLSILKMNKFNNAGKVKRSGTASFDITTILGLCCLLGLTWSFTFFSYGGLALPSYYIFTILNSFQGLCLFIYYVKTNTLFGDTAPSEQSNTSEETEKTENPYEEDLPTSTKKII